MLADLTKPTEINITGICKFWFAPVDWFKYFSIKHLSNIEVKYIEFLPIINYRWLIGYHNNENTEVETNPKQTDQGVIYESQVNLFIPGDDDSLRLLLTRMEQLRFVVMVKETTGTVKILGDKISACRMTFKFKNKQGKKGYDVIFSCSNTNPAYIYNGIIPL